MKKKTVRTTVGSIIASYERKFTCWSSADIPTKLLLLNSEHLGISGIKLPMHTRVSGLGTRLVCRVTYAHRGQWSGNKTSMSCYLCTPGSVVWERD